MRFLETQNGDASWEDAERQIREAEKRGGKGGQTVAVRKEGGGKRKAGEALAEAQREAEKEGGKRGGKKSKR